MEAHLPFFTASSSPSSAASSSSSMALNLINSSHAYKYDHDQFQGNNKQANGLFGLQIPVGLNSKNVVDMSQDMMSSGLFGEPESEGKMGKKKGEKKIRKPRCAFQTRSQVDILDDGYRWRKYGQKAVKNNKFPRSYYRCTYQGCNVKKQVQRLTKDEGIVVTTYEGMHSHPIEKSTDNFEHILSQMRIYSSAC